MLNSPSVEITEEQHNKNIRLANFRFMGTSQIIFLNYKRCLQEKGYRYYYQLYIDRLNEVSDKQITPISFEDFSNENYVDSTILKYCTLFGKSDIDYNEMSLLEKIEEVYQELIDESENMGNDKIVNKV